MCRYESASLPSTEPDLKKWCEDRWADKEESLRLFYNTEKRREFSSDSRCETPWNVMYLALVFWTGFTFAALYMFLTSSLAFYWVLFCTLGFILVSYFTDGIQQMEISLYQEAESKKIE